MTNQKAVELLKTIQQDMLDNMQYADKEEKAWRNDCEEALQVAIDALEVIS